MSTDRGSSSEMLAAILTIAALALLFSLVMRLVWGRGL
jgi:hypothetical protein